MIQRYAPEAVDDGYHGKYVSMSPYDYGDYVSYEDHKLIVAVLEQELADLKRKENDCFQNSPS